MRRQTRREMLGLQQGQSERAEHLRSLSQDPRDDPRVLRGRRNRVAAHGLSHGSEKFTRPPVSAHTIVSGLSTLQSPPPPAEHAPRRRRALQPRRRLASARFADAQDLAPARRNSR